MQRETCSSRYLLLQPFDLKAGHVQAVVGFPQLVLTVGITTPVGFVQLKSVVHGLLKGQGHPHALQHRSRH